jgi:hypothetical protein
MCVVSVGVVIVAPFSRPLVERSSHHTSSLASPDRVVLRGDLSVNYAGAWCAEVVSTVMLKAMTHIEVRSYEQRRADARSLREADAAFDARSVEVRADRPDPVARLEESNPNRPPDPVPVRYARMLVSPFGFLRGAAAPMRDDRADAPVTGLRVKVCGDARHPCALEAR